MDKAAPSQTVQFDDEEWVAPASTEEGKDEDAADIPEPVATKPTTVMAKPANEEEDDDDDGDIPDMEAFVEQDNLVENDSVDISYSNKINTVLRRLLKLHHQQRHLVMMGL